MDTLFGETEERLVDVIRKDNEGGVGRAIFNTVPDEKSRPVMVRKETEQSKFDDTNEEDDDLGVIPSFLRRSKLR